MTDGPAQEPAIRIRGLSKAFGRTLVLRKLDLDVSGGEVRAGDALEVSGSED